MYRLHVALKSLHKGFWCLGALVFMEGKVTEPILIE